MSKGGGEAQVRERACDYCNQATGLLYCRADAARLCLSCDQEVHATNTLFGKHVRSLLCDACHSAPASILCDSERSALCHDCDWERHRSRDAGPHHGRRPLDGFSGRPSLSELAGIFGFDDLGWEKPENGDDGMWGTSGGIGFDDLIVSGSGAGFRAMGVPPLPKNRNALCGQYKDEMINQLRNLCGSDPKLGCLDRDADPTNLYNSLPVRDELHPRCLSGGFDSEAELFSFHSDEENVLAWLKDPCEEAADQLFLHSPPLRNNYTESPEVPDQQLDAGGSIDNAWDGVEANLIHGIPSTSLPEMSKVPVHEFNSQERDSALCRYKEKRKTRRFDKHIRYESRKVRAESRTRVRGRFAKIDN